MLVFPNICPACASANGRRIIPESPEVDMFRCADCGHQWSMPAPPPRPPIPERALPWDWFKKKT